MSARKPLDEACTGGIDCPVQDHVRVGTGRWTRRWSHIPLTAGQSRTLSERRVLARKSGDPS